jgi:hypothetical protein
LFKCLIFLVDLELRVVNLRKVDVQLVLIEQFRQQVDDGLEIFRQAILAE